MDVDKVPEIDGIMRDVAVLEGRIADLCMRSRVREDDGLLYRIGQAHTHCKRLSEAIRQADNYLHRWDGL